MRRAGHTASLLPDGRVLVAGGCTQDSCEGLTSSTEIIDPVTGATKPGPDMTEPRVGHAAVTLPDGRILLIGGWGSPRPTASTDLFDPATATIQPGPPLLGPRADPLATLLPSGAVLVAGGYDGDASMATAELLQPGASAFVAAGSMAEARSAHAGVLLADGRVLVAGGSRADTGPVLETAEIYDPATDTWTPTGDLTVRRHKLAAIALEDGRVLVIGGSDENDGFGQYVTTDIWDPATGTFQAGPTMHNRRYKITAAVVRLEDGRVLVAGGAPDAEIFDPTTNAFVVVRTDVTAEMSFATAVLLPDGSVFVAGGYDSHIDLTDQVLRFVP